MGGERGRRTVEGAEATRKEVCRVGVDEYYREYYDLYGMDWEVIKKTRSREFRAGIFWDRVGAFLFLALGATLTLCTWSSRDFSFKDFGLFEWFMTVPLLMGFGGFVQEWTRAHWRKEVIRRYEHVSPPLVPPELGLEREGVSKPSYF